MASAKFYYAVIFTSRLRSEKGYLKMAEKMEALAKKQQGFLGLESVRKDLGITISYWESLDAIKVWKENSEHIVAQEKGKSFWYEWYKIRICKVEHEYEFQSLK